MLQRLLKYTKTIKGRTTLLIGSFLIILVSFSMYVYFQARQIKRDYHTYKTKWQAVQLQIFIEAFSVNMDKGTFYELILTQRVDSSNLNESDDKGINSVNENFKKKLDSINTNFNYQEPSLKLIETKKNINKTKKKLIKRILELKAKNQKDKILTDSLILNVLHPEIQASNNVFWSDFFGKVLSPVSDNAEKLAYEIKNRTIRLVAVVLIFFIALSIFYIYLWYRFIKSLSISISKPILVLEKLADGELVTQAEQTENELSTVIDATLKLSKNLKKASDFSTEIGKGNFDFEFKAISEKDELGNSLILMRNELKAYAEKEKQTNWTNLGIAKFSEILRKSDNSISETSYLFLSELIKYLHANQGGIFIINDSKTTLDMVACYAYNRKKYLEKQIEVGEGLIGQCFVEADKMYFTDLPSDYIKITSGLGFETPKDLLLVPIKTNEQVLGVIEIASFNSLKNFEIEFVEKIAENMAITIANIAKNELTKKLLAESTFATENLKVQEEEMRQNMEELFATQEEMKRKEISFMNEIEELKNSLAKYE